MSRATAWLYDTDGTEIGVVPGVVGLSALDEMDGYGGGSLTVHADNPMVDELMYRRVVKVSVGGVTRAAFIIRNVARDTVADDDAGRRVTVSGPGLLGLLEGAIVYQSGMHRRSSDRRRFSWGQESPSDAGTPWAPVVPVGVIRSDWTRRYDPFILSPVGWPSSRTTPTLPWPCSYVWPTPTQSQPAGDVYFRVTVTRPESTPDGTPVNVFWSSSNAVTVALDGELLASTPPRTAGYVVTYGRPLPINDDDPHTLVVRVTNVAEGSAGLAMIVTATEVDKLVSSQIMALTDPPPQVGLPDWECLAYPATPPGWTAGDILTTLIGEADARGVVGMSWLTTPTFTGLTDSSGETWPKVLLDVPVGDTIYQVVETLRDMQTVVRAEPDGGISAYARSTYGADLTDSVIIDAAAHVTASGDETAAPAANALLIRGNSQWVSVSDADSIYADGRVEAYADLSSYKGSAAADAIAAVLDIAKAQIRSGTVAFVEFAGTVPWADFAVGDLVSVSDGNGGYEPRRVVSIAAALDEAGNVVYEVELDRPSITRLERAADDTPTYDIIGGRKPGPLSKPPGGGGGTGGGGDDGNCAPVNEPAFDAGDNELADLGIPCSGDLEVLARNNDTSGPGEGSGTASLQTDIGVKVRNLTIGSPVFASLWREGSEIGDGGYSRRSVALTPTSGAASSTNTDAITWTANEPWDAVDQIGIHDNDDGTLLGYIPISPGAIEQWTALRVAAGSLAIQVRTR